MLSLGVGALQSDISIYKSPLLIQGFLYKDKMVSWPSYLYNRNTCISKVTYLYKWQSGYPQPHCWPNSEQNWEALRSGNSLCLSHGLSSVGSSTCSAVSAEVYSDWVGIIPNDVLKLLPSISNIRRTLRGNTLVDHSDVVGASPVGAAPTTSSWSTWHLASIDWAKTTATWDENLFSLGIRCFLY